MHYLHLQKNLDTNSLSVFPHVDTKKFHVSVRRFKKLMSQANLLIEKIADSDDFAVKLMNEAQLSNTENVEKLITSTGITSKVKASFTPSGIRIELDNSERLGECCRMYIMLQW
ncbi:hypothetical protein ACXYMX_14455 [Sporosarcina sp. CAU 1771]